MEEVLIRRAVQTTNQIIYDEELFDGFPNAVKVLKEFVFVPRRRPDLEELMMLFNEFVHISKVKNKTTSNTKQLSSPFSFVFEGCWDPFKR